MRVALEYFDMMFKDAINIQLRITTVMVCIAATYKVIVQLKKKKGSMGMKRFRPQV